MPELIFFINVDIFLSDSKPTQLKIPHFPELNQRDLSPLLLPAEEKAFYRAHTHTISKKDRLLFFAIMFWSSVSEFTPCYLFLFSFRFRSSKKLEERKFLLPCQRKFRDKDIIRKPILPCELRLELNVNSHARYLVSNPHSFFTFNSFQFKSSKLEIFSSMG